MSSPTKDEVQQAVGTALDIRHQAADAVQRGALLRTTLGSLRMLVDPTGGLPATVLSTLFGFPGTTDQVAQRVVDYWRAGLLDAPPYPQRPQMWPIVASAFQHVWEPVPDGVTLELLVNVSIGGIMDRYPNGPQGAKQGVGMAIVRGYAVGV